MNMKKGFTLIEIMIVVAIIAILAAIAIPNFIAYRQTAQLNACKANVQTIKNACEAWMVKNGSAGISATGATMADLTASTKGSPFLKKEPVCPVDNATTYSISYNTASQEYTVTCGKQGVDHDVSGTGAVKK